MMWSNPLNCDNAANCNDSSGYIGGNTHHGFVLDFPIGSGQFLLYPIEPHLDLYQLFLH